MDHQGDDYIAGYKTAADWRSLRGRLVDSQDVSLWREAFRNYFQERLDLRYLSPIRILQEHGTFQGEGFSIAAIQCSLIEFLESTLQGLTYRYVPRGQQVGQFEYSSSSEIFRQFLTQRYPFRNEFDSSIATDFYASVRCGLLHEARTKNGWRIWADDGQGRIIDPNQKIMYRNNFQSALLQFIIGYGQQLETDVNLQSAFIRKFDGLCR